MTIVYTLQNGHGQMVKTSDNNYRLLLLAIGYKSLGYAIKN